MTWNFRNRIELQPSSKLQHSGPEWLIDDSESGRQVKLVAKFPRQVSLLEPDALANVGPEPIGPLADARTVILRGSGYETEDKAMSAGELWRSRLMRAFAAINVGANFGGDQVPSGGATPYGLQLLAPGRRAMNDPHKLYAYEAEPAEPLFIVFNSVDAFVSSPHERLEEAMTNAVAEGGLSDENQVAYGLYAASFGLGYEARYALLMMALECLIRPQPRQDECRTHVQSLIDATEASGLPDSEIKSITGTLQWLFDQSIGQAGRVLAAQLRPQEYGGKDAVKFFTDCYGVRSRLTHGNLPLPTPKELGPRAAELERFVAALLSRS